MESVPEGGGKRTAARLTGLVLAASAGLVGCSQLFDADRGQCSVAADCAALGHAELACVDGLCVAESGAQVGDGASDGEDVDRDGSPNDGAPSDGSPGDGAPNDGSPNDGSPNDGSPNDGASSDGGSGDGTTGDGTTGARDDCPASAPGLLFCDGFEDDFAAWQRDSDPDALLGIVSDAPARGTRALSVETLRKGAIWAEVRAGFPEVNGAALWTRAFVYAFGDQDYEVITVLRVDSGGTDSDQGLDFSLRGSSPRALFFSDLGGEDREIADTRDFPVDTWTCVEMSFTPGILSASAALYIDGRAAGSLDMPLLGARFDTVRAGAFFTADAQGPVAVRIDAVAVSSQRIGCE